MDANLKKRKRVDFTNAGGPVKQPKVALTGPAFTQAIDNLTGPASGDVHTHVQIPTTYAHGTKTWPLDLHATFSGKDHNSTTDGTKWTQGWMDMGGETSYAKVLPASLTVERATVESRVMKKLARGAIYTPKPIAFNTTTRKDQMSGNTKNWGRVAMQSYVEDITAKSGLKIEETGSGMRALTLASKLQMKTAHAAHDAGFGARMLNEFPQLLTAETVPVGGAAHYNTLIHQEKTAHAGVSATQGTLVGKVNGAHDTVNRASRNRFNHKWVEIQAGRMTTTQAGNWWVNKFGAGVSGANSLSGSGVQKRTIRKGYTSNKLKNHGITHFK